MKVLYFYITNSFEGFLSFNVHIHELIENANRLENVEVVGFRPIVTETVDQAGYLNFYGKFKKMVPRWGKDILAIFSNFAEYRHAVKRIKEEKPDVLLFRYNFMNFYQILLQKRFKLPLVLEVNSPLSDERKRDGDLTFHRIALALEKWGWRSADKIHVVSGALKEILAKDVEADKIFVAHNGVNPEEYQPLTRNENERIRIGFVGSFGKYQGIDVLFEVIPQILDRYENVEFVLIGKGGLYEEYRTFFANSPYNDRVDLKGYVGREDIPQELVNFDISILLDFTEYGSPLKMFEYMMAGTAMILPDRKTIREIVNHGENGMLFTPRNAADFKEKIAEVIEDKVLREKLADAAKQKVMESYTWRHNAQRVTDELRGLLEK